MKVGCLLVPHDLTPLGDRTLARVAALGLEPRVVHVIHVLPRLDLSHPNLVFSKDDDEARRRHALALLAARLGPFPDAVPHVAIGEPGGRILACAREIGADLVVVATHARHGLERWVMGSTAGHLVRSAPCPVLVLPAEQVLDPLAAPAPKGAAQGGAAPG